MSDDLKKAVAALMKRVRRGAGLPGSEQVVADAFQRLGCTPEKVSRDVVLERFDHFLRAVWEESLSVLEAYETAAYSRGIPRELAKECPDALRAAARVARSQGFRAGVIDLFASWYSHLRLCFLSVSQSRKTRGGRDFELQIEGLLKLAEIPYERQVTENRTDFIVPSIAAYQRNRNEALVLSVKRTLRERWREVAEELFNLRSPNVYLLTADEDVSRGHVEGICKRYNIWLVVWDKLKQSKFVDEPLVLGYTEWARERISPLRR